MLRSRLNTGPVAPLKSSCPIGTETLHCLVWSEGVEVEDATSDTHVNRPATPRPMMYSVESPMSLFIHFLTTCPVPDTAVRVLDWIYFRALHFCTAVWKDILGLFVHTRAVTPVVHLSAVRKEPLSLVTSVGPGVLISRAW